MRKQEYPFKSDKLIYSKLENNKYTIDFPPSIFTPNFEKILKECYKRSKHQACNSVIFDISKVNFFDIFELGLLVSWLLDLKNQEKEIAVKFPPPEKTKIYGFLQDYAFEKFLEKYHIPCIKEGKVGKERFLGLEADALPLIFAYEERFQEYIEKLSDLEILKDAEVVLDGSFKNIIIKELRDNIREHTNDRLPYIITTKFRMKESEKDKERFRSWIKNRASYGVEWERPFFLKLLQSPDPSFFELVIGDMGPGIPKTLRKIDECKNKKEFEIVDYAFEYDSTSDPDRRFRLVKKWLEKEIKDYKEFPPGTGLYWVKDIMRRYNGFLSVRTGKTILCYDFLSYPERGTPSNELITNWTWNLDKKNKELENLCSFPGTHYKIYFPIKRLPWERKKTYFQIPYYTHISFKSKAILLKNYFGEDISGNIDKQLESLQKVLHQLGAEIEFLKKEISSEKVGLIIVDFMDIDKDRLLLKVLHYLVLEMMRRQIPNLQIIGVNVNSDILSEISQVGQKVGELGSIKEKALIILDDHLNLEFVGASEEQQKFLEKLIQAPLDTNKISKDEEKVVTEITHLFRISEEKYHFIFSREYIITTLLEPLKNEIKDYILNEKNNIFHPKEQVNVHNRYYVEGFFELYKLLENRYWKNKLQKWIEWELRLSDPSVIITIGRNSKNLLEDLKNEVLKNIEWLHIDKPLDPIGFSFVKLFMLDKSKKICIITELIGTGKSLNKVLEFLKDYKILNIFSIVDARKEEPDTKENVFEYKEKNYELKSIVRHPLKFYEDTKPGHWSYEYIKSVDPFTNALLIKPIVLPEEAIWYKMSFKEYKKEGDLVQDFKNPFLEKIVASSDSVISGHFITKSNKHITYFFLIKRIAEQYVKEIGDTVIKDIEQIPEKLSKLENILLLYPEYNPGVKLIVNYISKSLNINSRGINNKEIFNIFAEREWKGELGEIEAAIIFDDSFSTGFTIKRLIDIAYKAGPPQFIFAYALMNRADPFTSRFLSSISSYGIIDGKREIRIKHLVDAQIPLFDASNCPICRYIEKLKLLKEEMEKLKLEGNEQLKKFLSEEISKKQSKDIESLQDTQVFTLYFSDTQEERIKRCIIRWKLEIAKSHIGARNELKRMIEEYDQNPNNVLILLKVIHEEIMYFFEIQKDIFERVFYATFKDKLKEACNHFSTDSKILSENLGAIISVWYFINTEDFFKHLNEILKTTFKHDINLFWKTILHTLICETITKDSHIDIMIDILTTFSNTPQIVENPNVGYELKKLIEYFQRKADKFSLPSLYHYYIKAILAPYYFDNKYKSICEYLVKKNLEEAKKHFSETVLHAKKNLHWMEHILKSDILTVEEEKILQESYDRLKQIIEQYENFQMTGTIDREEFEKMVEEFKSNFDNARKELDNLKCDVPSTVNSVLVEDVEVKKIFEVCQIKIEENYEAEFVFIRKKNMETILHELFTNLRHAFPQKTDNNKIKILTRNSLSGEFVSFEILDNREPPKEKFGRGHLLVRTMSLK